MSLDLTPEIEAEIAAAQTCAIDLFEIHFSTSIRKYWSNRKVDQQWYSGVTFVSGLTPSEFSPLVLEVSEKTWSLGAEQNAVTLTLSNPLDGEIDDIVSSYGVAIFSGALVYC